MLRVGSVAVRRIANSGQSTNAVDCCARTAITQRAIVIRPPLATSVYVFDHMGCHNRCRALLSWWVYAF